MKTLYKQNSDGGLQEWTIAAKGNSVTTVYGQVGGKLQTTVDLIREGKNLGRANATTPEAQALAQAQQQYDAKLKKGYQPSMALAASTKNVLGAVEPMLAFPIEKKPKAVEFPALAQPKLDGLRCIAIIEDGKARLFSRTQKPIATVPHIVAELEALYKGQTLVVDGELYSHAMSDDFNSIIHLVKRDDVHADSKAMEYHCYDVVAPGGYMERTQPLRAGKYCKLVETVWVKSMAELEDYQAKAVGLGYEGAMYRNVSGPYEHKRSAYLLKVKTFVDSEFLITGAEEGSGKLMGCVGAFTLVTDKGVAFKAMPICTLAQAKEYWRVRASLVGRYGTVKFQGMTPDGSLRFPKFKAVRED